MYVSCHLFRYPSSFDLLFRAFYNRGRRMDVFFVSAPRSGKSMGDMLARLYREIRKLGHTHVSDFIATSPQVFESDMEEGKQAMRAFYQEMAGSVRKADICVFEASVASLGVGFLIEKALSLSKPVIVLFYREQGSFLLPGVGDERLIIRVYDETDYRQVLAGAFAEASALGTRRISFLINDKLYSFLEKASALAQMTKPQYLRSLLAGRMKRQLSKRQVMR